MNLSLKRGLFADLRVLVASLLIGICLALCLPAVTVSALTTADVTVNATPAFVGISCNVSDYDFGVVNTSSTTNTSTSHFGITNTSTVQTDQTISVTTENWSCSGVDWIHSDTATQGADTAGLKSNKGGSWGTGDVIVEYASPGYIYENCPATTNYAFGLGLWAPTSFTDGTEKEITLRVSAAAG